jgi:raffinose/stachyose/melibiose transport system substrate-binding protein
MTRHMFRGRVRLAGLTASALAGAIVLAGCQDAGSEASGPVTIRLAVQTQTGKTKPYTEIVNSFNASNAQDITVEIVEVPNADYAQSLKTMFQGGNAPDVVYGSPGTGNPNSLGLYADAGQIIDLSGEKWATSSVPESARDLYYVQDQLIGVPLDVVPVPQVVNVTAYEKVGIPFAKTFDELLAQCKTVRDAGLTSLLGVGGSVAPATGIMAMEFAATRVYAQDPEWNRKRAADEVTFADSQGWKDTLQAVVDLRDNGCFQDGVAGATIDLVTNEFTAGRTLAVFAPASIAADLASLAPKEKISLALFPGKTGEDGFLFASPSNALGINADSKHQDAAKALLEYWMKPEQLRKFAELSGSVSLTSVIAGEPVGERFSNIESYLTDPKKNAPLANLFWPNGEVYNEFGVGIQGLLTGQANIDQVLKAMDAAWAN